MGTKGHFIVMIGSEGGADIVLIQTVNRSLTFTRKLGYKVHYCKMVYWNNKIHKLKRCISQETKQLITKAYHIKFTEAVPSIGKFCKFV